MRCCSRSPRSSRSSSGSRDSPGPPATCRRRPGSWCSPCRSSWAVAFAAGLYRRVWRHASVHEVERILLAATVSGAACFAIGAALIPGLGLAPVRVPLSRPDSRCPVQRGHPHPSAGGGPARRHPPPRHPTERRPSRADRGRGRGRLHDRPGAAGQPRAGPQSGRLPRRRPARSTTTGSTTSRSSVPCPTCRKWPVPTASTRWSSRCPGHPGTSFAKCSTAPRKPASRPAPCPACSTSSRAGWPSAPSGRSKSRTCSAASRSSRPSRPCAQSRPARPSWSPVPAARSAANSAASWSASGRAGSSWPATEKTRSSTS